MKKGVGLVCIHYAVEVPKAGSGEATGGYGRPAAISSRTGRSTRTGRPTISSFPTHPITRGVKPFTINDEWYYHMRFLAGMEA